MKTIYLLCGVPASGKSWVCNQLTDKFTYLSHDKYLTELPFEASLAATTSSKPILIDCPFDERALRTALEHLGLIVIPIFIVEAPQTIIERYTSREGKPPSKSIVTRATSILNKVTEWNAFSGNSKQVLEYLKGV